MLDVSNPIGRTFTGDALREIAFPLGGIGTGTISLGGRGNLRDWEIFNRPAKGNNLPFTFFALWLQAEGEAPVARVLERQLLPPFVDGAGLSPGSMAGLPRFADATFTGAYPFAWLKLNDPLIPLREIEDMQAHWSRYQLDPLNPRTHTYPKDDEIPDDEDFSFSLLELPDASAQPWITSRPDVAQGRVEMFRLHSEILDNERRVWIYTPSCYEKSGEPYGLLLVFDGLAYIHPNLVPTPTILDNLLHAGKIPPLVAVFPDSLSMETRSSELPCNPSFVEYLTSELLSWVRERYHVTDEPARTIVAGSSYGGLAAAFVGLTAPQVFGNVLSQSGAFWYNGSGRHDIDAEWMLPRRFVEGPHLPLRFYLEAGLLERTRDADMVLCNRHMRDVLEAKGYEVTYSEYMGGHDYICWRGSFADGLLALVTRTQ